MKMKKTARMNNQKRMTKRRVRFKMELRMRVN